MNKVQVKATREDLIRENARLHAEISILKKSRLASNASSVLRELIKYGFIALTIIKSVELLAGKYTILDAKIDAAVDLCASIPDLLKELAPVWWIELLAIIGVIAIGLANKRLRILNKKLSARIGEATQKYEALIDPNRRSSGLGNDGQTHSEDEL